MRGTGAGPAARAWRRHVATLGIALCLTAPAARGDETAAPTVPLDALVTALTLWAAETLALDPPAGEPAIVFTDRRRMVRMLRPDAAASAASTEVEALYDPAARAIHLPSGWRGATAGEVSVLVHEIVHHLQAASGQRFACPQERERDAYALQARWLEHFGGSLERDLDLDPMFVLVAAHCGP